MEKEYTDAEKLEMACKLVDTCKQQMALLKLAKACIDAQVETIDKLKECITVLGETVSILEQKVKILTQNN